MPAGEQDKEWHTHALSRENNTVGAAMTLLAVGWTLSLERSSFLSFVLREGLLQPLRHSERDASVLPSIFHFTFV